MSRRSSVLVTAFLIACAAWFVVFQLGAPVATPLGTIGAWANDPIGVDHPSILRDGRRLSHDVYGGFFPNLAYAVARLHAGGSGLLWNPYQNCGQPFLAMITNALLYPPHLLAAVVGADHALRLIPFVNLVLAGLFTYALCRELGTGVGAAVCGAVAFELGHSMADATVWVPIISGSYAWLPAAVLCCDRAVRRPSVTTAVALGVVLAMQLLAGFPQLLVYTYQLVALRAAWELATARPSRPGRAVLAVCGGMALAPCFAAVQLLPAIEATIPSARSGGLSIAEMAVSGFLDWPTFRLSVAGHLATFQPLLLVSCVVAAAAWRRRATVRHALFFAAVGATALLLAFGPNTPLFAWYLKLPLTDLFRDPKRITWLTGLSVAVLTALGVDALQAAERPSGTRALAVVATLAVALACWRLAPDGLDGWSVATGALAVGGVLLGVLAPAARRAVPIAVLTALLLELVVQPARTYQYLLPDASPVFAYAPAFTRLRARLTPQTRADFFSDDVFDTRFAFQPKSASLYGVPSLVDYQPQLPRRYAEYFLMLRTGFVPETLAATNFYWRLPMLPGFRRRLLDLAAARFLMIARAVDASAVVGEPPLRLVEEDGPLRLYENPTALPRAYWVPHVDVVPDPRALLDRLANGSDDRRSVALLDADLPSGFRGTDGAPAGGGVRFVRDDPEDVVLAVDAPARGFVFLADQFFAGWTATVDGAATPIARANHVFRLVEVPAGTSTVEFRYAPASVRWGVAGTVLSILTAALAVAWERRALRRPASA